MGFFGISDSGKLLGGRHPIYMTRIYSRNVAPQQLFVSKPPLPEFSENKDPNSIAIDPPIFSENAQNGADVPFATCIAPPPLPGARPGISFWGKSRTLETR